MHVELPSGIMGSASRSRLVMAVSDVQNKFWDNGPFYQHLGAFPGFGIEGTADKIGLIAAGVTAAGIAGHAIATNIKKRKTIKDHYPGG